MPLYAIARTAKQKGGSVASSGHHNDRTRETLNADPERKDQNRTLIGDERNVRESVSQVIREHGGKPRSDSVEAVEMVLTATHEFFTDERGEIDEKKVDKFVDQATAFLRDPRSGGICVKAVLHLDERTPHVQAHKVPIDPQGTLNCKHYFGGREKMVAFQDLYHEYMQPLGLERGERGSRARHTDIQKFYGAITEEHHLKISAERLPDPPLIRTEKAVKKYKKEVIKAVNEQVKEPLRVLHHQAMLTREERSKSEAMEKLAASRVAAMERTTQEAVSRFLAAVKEINELREHNDRLGQTITTLRSELTGQREKTQELARTAGRLGDRLRDIPLPDVMERLGYGREQIGDSFVYRDANKQVGLVVADLQLRDPQQKVLGQNSLEVVLYMRNNNEGHSLTRTDAIRWLSENFGEQRAAAAFLVEREQAITQVFDTWQREREGQQLNRADSLTPERGAERAAPEMAPDRSEDRGFSFER